MEKMFYKFRHECILPTLIVIETLVDHVMCLKQYNAAFQRSF